RRIERRMGLHQIDGIARYVHYIRENPKEAELLFQELLIGVTSFFRDPATWERLASEALPGLLATCAKSAVLRAWAPACSTGEEAYSLAIAFKEALERSSPSKGVRLQVFATDLDPTAIERGRQGVYPATIATDVSPERLARFFVEDDHGYRVRKEIRDLVVFATQNVLQDPPFTKLDLLTCRNLLIYLSPEVQQRLIPLFHYSLKPNGILCLGNAETVGRFTDLFAALDGKSRLYRRLEPAAGAVTSSEFPTAPARPPHREAEPAAPTANHASAPSFQTAVEQYLLGRFAPAAVITNHKGDVLYVSGRTEKYLEVPAGKANWNVFAMARRGLRGALAGPFQKAIHAKKARVVTELGAKARGSVRAVDVTLEPIDEPPALRDTVMILFADAAVPVGRGKGKSKRALQRAPVMASVERELEQARGELRGTRDEMQASEEELKSANEELQSTNEELQSTNEELTTSKEEMQSMNEELQTLNHELQAKVDDMSRASNDMKNLLDATEIAILFLDESLNVRRFTPQATSLFKLIPSDIGRPLADLASRLAYPELYDDAGEVLRTLAFKEKTAKSADGRSFRVRIMPYRTSDNRIDGVVITLTNVNSAGVDRA
ncbi:MAG TPA: CheR family methyltransferase, partial [Polyangiaceae bacterium]|nr:CheR family methyltransferase [Polyangiaceae bacterium]